MLQRDEQGKLDTVMLGDHSKQQPTEEKQQEVEPAWQAVGERNDCAGSGLRPSSPLTLDAATAPAEPATDTRLLPATLPPDLGMYLLSFLRLYGYEFDYGSLGISVRPPGHYFLKAQRQWLHPHNPQLLCVENPLDPSIDLGFKVFNIGEIVAYLKDAYLQLTRDQPVSVRTTGGRAESEGELVAIHGSHDVDELKESRVMPVLSAITSTLADFTLRSPSPQQLPSASFDHLRISSAPAHPLQSSTTPSSLSTSTPSSASSSASSQHTPSRASTTSPASPTMKQPTAVPLNGFHYSLPGPLNSHPQSALFYPSALYASPVGHSSPAAGTAGGAPPPASSAPSGPAVCMAPCCFPLSHVLVYDRQGNLVYIPASFASQLQQANVAQLALPNGQTYALFQQSTANGITHAPSPQQQQQQSHQSAPYMPPSSPPAAGAGSPYSALTSHHSAASPHASHGGNVSNQPYMMNGHSLHPSHPQSPHRPSPSKQRNRKGAAGGKGKRNMHSSSGNGHSTQVDLNGPTHSSQWQRS